MYSDKPNIQILLSLLKAHNIREVVLCPGSRNAPIIHSIANDTDFICHQMTDERSAAFYAMGVALRSQSIVAVCCTSGSALLNMAPAVAEAYYRKIPLLIISADRPPQWIGQMDGQTLPQPGAFGAMVKHLSILPEVKDEKDHLYCNRLINEALIRATERPFRPVHINIPIDEPLFDFTTPQLPKERVIREKSEIDEEIGILLRESKRVMIIAGQAEPHESLHKIVALTKRYSWLLLSEQISNISRSESIQNFDLILYALPKDRLHELLPDVVITMGGHIVSKRLKQLLRRHPEICHIHVSEEGECIDLFGSLRYIIKMRGEDFISSCHQCIRDNDQPPSTAYCRRWQRYSQAITPPSFAYSEMQALGELISRLLPGQTLHLANSSVIRYAQLYTITEEIGVYANRGVNGIEGSLSTAIGAAAGERQLHLIAIGDLSFFYDMNALWAESLSLNSRILLLNNSGGEIFNALPGLDTSSPSGRFILGRHETTAKGWAISRGLEYHEVRGAEELERAISALLRPESKSPILVEVMTDKDTDIRQLKAYYHEIKDILNNQ